MSRREKINVKYIGWRKFAGDRIHEQVRDSRPYKIKSKKEKNTHETIIFNGRLSRLDF